MPLAPANLVPNPKFTSAATSGNLWTSTGLIELKDGAGLSGGQQRRLTTGNSTTKRGSATITLAPDPRIKPGAALNLFIRYSAYNNGGQPTVSIEPLTADGPIYAKSATADLPYSTPYVSMNIPLTLPAWTDTEVVSMEGPWGFTEYRRADITGYRLAINSGPTSSVWVGFSYTRVDVADSAWVGYFDGDNLSTSDYTFGWEGTPGASASRGTSTAVTPPPPDPVDPPPTDPTEPPPATGEDPLAARVAAHIGRAGDAATIAQASVHLATVRAYVWGYTRGRGFLGREISWPDPAIEVVIVSACTRLTANPEQIISYTAGDYSERGAILQGFTLPELAILNNYRRRYV